VVLYSTRQRRQKVIQKYDGSRATLSLHSSGHLVLHQFGWENSSFFLFDTETEAWSPLATFGGRGIGGVWHVDFSGERAVWDVASGGGIMTAVASRPEETSRIGYTGAEEWSPGISGDVVCWNERPRGCADVRRGCPGEAIRCVDLGTGEGFVASADLPPEYCLILDGPGQSVVSVSGPWVLYHAIRCDEDLGAVYWDRAPSSIHSRLFHRGLGRSFPLTVLDAPVGAYVVTGDHVAIGYYPWWDGAVMPKGLYRCDLRVLFPEAYAAPPPDAPADGGED